ncbi:MAG: hypothetical protein CMP10_19530 [Zetaproteobacteria bacterium]|nr:hypothetical protein [Pseudobdellovibrionaceae bacterium]
MVFSTTFIHMDRTESLELFAKQKITKIIDSLASQPINTHVTFSVNGNRHRVRLTLKDRKGEQVVLHYEADSMYKSVAILCEKLKESLRRKKDKNTNRKFFIPEIPEQIHPS